MRLSEFRASCAVNRRKGREVKLAASFSALDGKRQTGSRDEGREDTWLSQAAGVLLGCKLIVDMFPAFALLDYAMLVSALMLFVAALREFAKIKLGLIDAAALFVGLLLVRNALYDPEGAVIAVKIASALLLFFVGRVVWRGIDQVLRCLWIAAITVLVVNSVTLATGVGFQIWGGGANTFSGMYFFKTDLASAMCFVVILALFYEKPWRVLRIAVVVAASILLLLSNARAYYFILPCLLLFRWMLYKKVRLGVRHAAVVAIIIVAMLFVLRFLGTTEFFQSMHFISFDFESFADLFNGSNTQGRDYLFAVQMGRVADSSLMNQLFGNGFTGDVVLMNGALYAAHSLYIGTIFNLGYVGMALVVAIVLAAIIRARCISNQAIGYFAISLAVTLLVSGISFDVLQYTANTWTPFFVFGVVLSMHANGRTGELDTKASLLERRAISAECNGGDLGGANSLWA